MESSHEYFGDSSSLVTATGSSSSNIKMEEKVEKVKEYTSAKNLDSNNPSGDGGVSDSVKFMADKHSVVRSHLQQAQIELTNKLEAIKILEDKIRSANVEVCLAEQKLRGLDETLYLENETFQDLERRHHQLISESVEIDWKIIQMEELIKNMEKKAEVTTSKMDEFKKRVLVSMSSMPESNESVELKNQIDNLLDIKERLERGDEDLKKILNGEALQLVEAQKGAIMEAYAEEEMELELLQQQFTEKENEVKKVQQTITIQEKQNQARLLKMQKQLGELKETEKHLQSTVQYMESQIDFGTK